MKRYRIPFITVLHILVVFAFLSLTRSTSVSADQGHEWTRASPDSVGIDLRMMEKALAFAQSKSAGDVHSLLVVRHGVLAFEHYFGGFDADKPHAVWSVTKTITALLTGIAHDRGLLTSLDTPVLDYLPAYSDLRTGGREGITLRHVLTMSSGLAWNEKLPFSDRNNTLFAALNSPQPYRYLLEKPQDAIPGHAWLYNSIAPGLLLAAIRQTNREPIDAFAQTALFGPLGIRAPSWERLRNGDPNGGFGLSLRPRDMAKIGQMMLAGGLWRGQRIVSDEWIAEMTKPRFNAENRSYGYQTWLEQAEIDGRTIAWIGAYGYGGQRIIVVPSLDMVVVITAGNFETDPQEKVPYELLTRFILPAVTNPN